MRLDSVYIVFNSCLIPRILKKNEVKPPDYEELWSLYNVINAVKLYRCMNLYESDIKDSLETINNPFGSNQSIILGDDNRATQLKKRKNRDYYRKGVHKYTPKGIDYEVQEDPDIQAELDKGNNVTIIEDSLGY